MALPNQKFREVVFQLLYSTDMGNEDEEVLFDMIMQQLHVTKKTVLTAYEKAKTILSHKDAIDKQIREAAVDYDFARIPSAERNILRLAIYELLHDDEVPPKVAIAESLRLTKKFSTAEAAAFVNAVIDRIYKESLPAS